METARVTNGVDLWELAAELGDHEEASKVTLIVSEETVVVMSVLITAFRAS